MQDIRHKVVKVIEGSIADELGIQPGFYLISIDGYVIDDIFDYGFYIDSEHIIMNFIDQDGEEWEYEIDKDANEDIGLVFKNDLMSNYRSCANKCIFCFIDQMPPNMRKTLYFKDDDSRLSFLQGNYVTLTNMSDDDIDRIIRFNLAPINISIHTTNHKLRNMMLGNKNGGASLRYIDRLYDAGIEMNGQIVLCKGYNDKDNLRSTLEDLLKYAPTMKSISVVPVGLTDYRAGLTKLEPIGKEDAIDTLNIIDEIRHKAFDRYGIHFVHASDEIFLIADKPIPDEDEYDGYPQIENGVGMIRNLITEIDEQLKKDHFHDTISDKDENILIATGMLASKLMIDIADKIMKIYKNKHIKVCSIKNDFFGHDVTVSGLITGNDFINRLQAEDDYDRILIPINMLRAGTNVMLDDITLDDIEKKLDTKVTVVGRSGRNLLYAILSKEPSQEDTYNKYEGDSQ